MTKFSASPHKLYKAEQVRAMDSFAIKKLGISGFDLMNRAGEAAFKAMRSRWPDARTVSVLCGSGNNAGDGYIFAAFALKFGMDVKVYPLSPVYNLKNDALKAYQTYQSLGGEILDFVPADFEGAEVVVDAIFGSGLDRPVTDFYAEVIKGINRFSGIVLALDIPSGLNADTGCPMNEAVKADLTVTFIGVKQGLLTGEGLEYCGEIVFDDLDTPFEVQHSQKPSAESLPDWKEGLNARSKASHKGDYGHVLVIGGDSGFSGAARLAGEAALRVGAGLVSIATHPCHAAFLNLSRPELMCHGIETAEDLDSLLERADVVAVGPGLGQSAWSKDIWRKVKECDKPCVVDADALNLLAGDAISRDNWILTPHPGEAARLLGCSSDDIQADRFKALNLLQKRLGGVIILKGSGTLILEGGGLPYVSISGNPGMASGGMGDVLTGVIAGLLAQGLSLSEAAKAGVRLHGAAGDVAALDGERGLLAHDLMEPLRQLIN